MERFFTIFVILTFMFGCAIISEIEPIQPVENSDEIFINVATDTLQLEITEKNIIIDSKQGKIKVLDYEALQSVFEE